MNIESLKPPRVGEPTTELEKLLSLAEELQDKLEMKNRVIERLRGFQYALLGLTVTFVTVFQVYKSEASDKFQNLQIVLAGMVAGYILLLEILIRQRRDRLVPDENALSELLALIRETESALAESEGWSTLERAQFRIRLSRFGIGATSAKPSPTKSRPRIKRRF